jgi:diguanylate cyclase (GGDEF)-like protein
MDTELIFHVCPYYLQEVQAAIERIELFDVHVRVEADACSQSRQSRMTRKRSASGCGIRIVKNPEDPSTSHRIQLNYCLTLLADQRVLEHYQHSGAYVVSSGWLRNWPERLKEWGFDQATACEFFHEWASELVLIDTFVDLQAPGKLSQMAAYLDLPYRIHPQGLEFLQLTLARYVHESRQQFLQQQQRQTLEKANQRIADYAMAFDLLVRISHLRSEAETIQGICDLFAMLCGCGKLFYAAVNGSEIKQINVSLGSPPPQEQLAEARQQLQRRTHLIDDENGFMLAIRHQQELLGIVGIGVLTFPDRQRHYLNISLAIADICGLAISNARTFSGLIETREQLYLERDRTEQLRQMMTDLAGELDLQAVCVRVLEHLHLLQPDCQSRLLLHEGDHLRIVGQQQTQTSALQNQIISLAQPPYERVLNEQETIILRRNSDTESIFKQPDLDELQTWIGLPLISKERIIGILTLGSNDPDNCKPRRVQVLRAFADEATIAIENARAFQNVQALADTDALTGLFSRRHFDELALKTIEQARANGRTFSLILIDIDHFKRINDRFGHAIGDKALIAVANNLRGVLRTGDILARYGGEEFVVLLPNDPLPTAMSVAERLRKTIDHNSIDLSDQKLHLTISLGVAEMELTGMSLNDLFIRADNALYRAKEIGRNRSCAWEQ